MRVCADKLPQRAWRLQWELRRRDPRQRDLRAGPGDRRNGLTPTHRPMTLRTFATGTLLAAALLVVVFAFDLALLLFGAVLIAVVLSGLTARLAAITRLPRMVCLVLVLVFIVGGLAAVVV